VAGCPYEGPVSPEAVRLVATKLLEMGCYEISLGDTIGTGTPVRMEQLFQLLLSTDPASKFAVHFHDTWGLALANILVALQAGISVIDSSAAGLGGCPYAPGATGNVATEDVLHMLHSMGIETGVDIHQVAEAGREICAILKRTPSSKVSAALGARLRR
jgi:hydroxymethylglutaryl-CoA lyase